MAIGIAAATAAAAKNAGRALIFGKVINERRIDKANAQLDEKMSKSDRKLMLANDENNRQIEKADRDIMSKDTAMATMGRGHTKKKFEESLNKDRMLIEGKIADNRANTINNEKYKENLEQKKDINRRSRIYAKKIKE